MREVVVSEFVTLDGRMEAPGSERSHPHAGWTYPYGDERMFGVKLHEARQAGSLLLGRVTFEAFAAAWRGRTGEFAEILDALPKHVASTTLRDPGWNATILGGDVVGAVDALRRDTGGPVLVYGSARLVHTLLSAGLVDELRLMVFPVTIGGGLTVFPQDGAMAAYTLVDVERFDSGVTLQTFRPAR